MRPHSAATADVIERGFDVLEGATILYCVPSCRQPLMRAGIADLCLDEQWSKDWRVLQLQSPTSVPGSDAARGMPPPPSEAAGDEEERPVRKRGCPAGRPVDSTTGASLPSHRSPCHSCGLAGITKRSRAACAADHDSAVTSVMNNFRGIAHKGWRGISTQA